MFQTQPTQAKLALPTVFVLFWTLPGPKLKSLCPQSHFPYIRDGILYLCLTDVQEDV